jgi:hypothetical protein
MLVYAVTRRTSVAGIDEVAGDLIPEDKLAAVRRIARESIQAGLGLSVRRLPLGEGRVSRRTSERHI